MPKRPSPIQFSLAALAFAALGAYFVHTRPPTEQTLHALVDDEVALTEYIKIHGVRATMVALSDEDEQNNTFTCHRPAHAVGRIAYEVVGKEAFRQCNDSCLSGCYHGAMESLLSIEGTNNLTEKIEDICRIFDTRFRIHECFHGVGHGVLAYLDYDLSAALDECRKLHSPEHQSSCISGVFMENVVIGRGLDGADDDTHTTAWLNNDPHFPCNAVSQDAVTQYRCYLTQTSWMAKLFEFNGAEVAAECLNAPADHIDTCFQSYGRDAVDRNLDKPKKILRWCDSIPSAYYDACVRGALSVITGYWNTNLQSQASTLCKAVDDEHKTACYQYIAARLQGIFNNDAQRQVVCDTFEPEYRSICQNPPPWMTGTFTAAIDVPVQTTPVPLPDQTLTITMTDRGFVPQKITIKKGQTVTFINTGSNPHWPASNLHPTHEIYPAFDPERRIAPGESWSFTFLNVGVWRMHDHVYANFSGVITVIE